MATYRIRNDKISMPSTLKPAKANLKIILDSNAFFVPLQFKIDVFEELGTLVGRNFEPILLSPILKEIERMAKKDNPKIRKDAKYALKLAERCKLVRIDDAMIQPDDAIVQVAHEWKCPVLTNDMPLKKRLRDINVPVIYVRQKSRLEIDGRL
ncbi:MAG TPA: DNA-binding protein [Candidatus Bathyarchaeia archaeon]|nr:DNA-binding protein [Candidatus Bathyarchaeia archaeon]